MLFNDRQIRVRQHAAVEAGEGQVNGQGFDQHPHPKRRPGAGEGEADPTVAEGASRVLGRFRQHLVVIDQRAVDVGEQKADIPRLGHVVFSGARTGRQERPPSSAISLSAASGPSLPEA